MARTLRIDMPGVPQHLITRGNDRAPCFFEDADRQVYLRCLAQAAGVTGCDLHAYVLMTNHVHLLATGNTGGAVSRMMQVVGTRYARYVNRTYGRTGTLFEGRFKSSLVDSERYFMTCMCYIELNPVRAGMVNAPATYPWSSFGDNACGAPSGLLTPHPEYLRLGNDPAFRLRAYRSLFDTPFDETKLAEIRRHIQRNRALGGDAFRRAIEATLGRCVGIVARGRPPRAAGK
jgi:putative transposase